MWSTLSRNRLPMGRDGVKHDGWTWGSIGGVRRDPDKIWIALGRMPFPGARTLDALHRAPVEESDILAIVSAAGRRPCRKPRAIVTGSPAAARTNPGVDGARCTTK